MGLLDKANPKATPASVRRAAIVVGVIVSVCYLTACIWNPAARERFVVLFPVLTCLGAALGGLLEWQMGPDFDMADVINRLERAFEIQLDHAEAASWLTVGDLWNAVRESLDRQQPDLVQSLAQDDVRRRFCLELSRAMGIDEDEVVDSARFYFDIP